jgi:serine phosphatase RsbU (regulator of sigma subunit)
MVQAIIKEIEKMSIAKKLGLAISPLVVLCVCLVIFSYQNMKQIQEQIPNISEFAITSTVLVHDANNAFDRQIRYYEDVVFMHDLDMLGKAKEASEEISGYLLKLRKLGGSSSETQDMIDDCIKRLSHYTNSAGIIYKRMSEDDKYLENPSNALGVKNLGTTKNALETVLRGFSEIVRRDLSQKIESVNTSAKIRNNINALISSVIIAISILIIFLLIERSVTRPMIEANRKLQKAMNALWGEMELAKRIQTCLLPEKPGIFGYDIAASCEPSEEVGGDYYDVISVGGYDWIVIGDVSGHGVTSGLVMMMVQTAIHTVLSENPSVPPSDLLSVINRTIYANIEKMNESKHMTILVIACGKDGFFDFSGLHEDILFWCSDTRKVHKIETDGMWIGLEPEISSMLPVNEFRMERGDCVVLYTDGIIEARGKDGSFFGAERLEKIISLCGSRSAAEIHAAVLDALKDYEKPDDVTLFVMKRV